MNEFVPHLAERDAARAGALHEKALGATSSLSIGRILDPFGHRWMIGRDLEKLTEAEILERAAKLGAEDA